MIFLSGADVVLPSGVLSAGTVVLDDTRIVEVLSGERSGGPRDRRIDLRGRCLVPGFIDVHVHGVEGFDTLDAGDPIDELSRRLPQYGVTAFCPTSIACDPQTLERMLHGIRRARTHPSAGARVLPAHLESNFINPDYRGAQPLECLRAPRGAPAEGDFTGDQILSVIAASRDTVGIVTVAPELDGALDLIADLTQHGHRVSLGHSGASYEHAIAGIEAGASQATHLFNRMPPLGHRAPGLAGAVLHHDAIAAEVICDLVHVHPAMVRLALSAKRAERFMAITDGTAGSGLPFGSTAVLGGRKITIGKAAILPDGTIGGSTIAMDRAFANLVTEIGVAVHEAAFVCSTTPAREMGLGDLGVITAGALADLVVLDRDLQVLQTVVDGRFVFDREHPAPASRLQGV
jgi:N-acetylglucosamine-6-phosphate deacetylase